MANRPYIPQEWNVGDIITADKLNILEQAIYDIDEDVLNQTNNDKVLAVKNAHIVVTELSNLLPDGDATKY